MIHAHAPQATLMALTRTNFVPVSLESAFIGAAPVMPFFMRGSDELGETVALALGGEDSFFMENHRPVVAISSLQRAAHISDVAEVTAQKPHTRWAMGGVPPMLPKETVRKIRKMGNFLT